MTIENSPFKTYANEYDEWFDSERGSELFDQEFNCLHQAIGSVVGRWLEVGVGSGRFASALGVSVGVDPIPEMVRLASARGIETYLATGEELPFEKERFDGVLMVCSICFLDDPEKAFSECWRVLKESGRLVVGFIPANSQWGHYHSQRGQQSHRFYSSARFYLSEDIKALANRVGFVFKDERSCILEPPKEFYEGGRLSGQSCMEDSFIALTFVKNQLI